MASARRDQFEAGFPGWEAGFAGTFAASTVCGRARVRPLAPRRAGWKVFLDPPSGPEANMEADRALARTLFGKEPMPTLRVYGWTAPAVTLGRKQPKESLPAGVRELAVPFVRRPTGGGAVLHRTDETTYALAFPSEALPEGLPLRRVPEVLHRRIREGLAREAGIRQENLAIHAKRPAGRPALCFEGPVEGDLIFRGAKAGGCALRAWREGFLLQGALQGLPVAPEKLSAVLVRAVEETFSR